MSRKYTMVAGAMKAGALVAVVALGGCQTTTEPEPYSMSSAASTDAFEQGTDRPPSATTLYRMARILSRQQKDAQAEAVLRASIHRYPTFLPAYAELAALQVRQQKIDDAAATLESGLVRAPEDAVLRNDLGMCRMLSGNYEGAQAEFERAVAADPENTRYQMNVALAVGMRGNYDEALALYEEVLVPSRAHYNVGVIAEAREDKERAALEFEMSKSLESGKGVAEKKSDEEPKAEGTPSAGEPSARANTNNRPG